MESSQTSIKSEPLELTTTATAPSESEIPKKEVCAPSTPNNVEKNPTPPLKRDCHGKPKHHNNNNNNNSLSINNSNLIVPETTILPLTLQTNIFFELFYDGPYDLSLSNRSWGIHRVPPPNRAIVLSEIAYALFNITISPSYKKQVIFTDHLKFKAFVLDKLVVEKTLDSENTQEDFEQSFAEIVNMVVCKGGPYIEDMNQEIMLSRCAFKDFYSNRWRHKSCTIIIEKGEEVCRPCSYLDKYFQEWLKYNSKDK